MMDIQYPSLLLESNFILNRKPRNCQLCNTVFRGENAIPFPTECGHFFCKRKCEKTLKQMGECAQCKKPLKERPKIFAAEYAKPQQTQNNQTKRTYIISIFNPQNLMTLKEQVTGSTLLKDFMEMFPSLAAYLSDSHAQQYTVFTNAKGYLYGEVKNLTIDQLKDMYGFVSMDEEEAGINTLQIANRFKGGRSGIMKTK